MNQSGRVDAGKITGVYGIKGWVRVKSYTEPKENLLSYSPWLLRQQDGEFAEWRIEEGRSHGKGLIVKFDGIETPESAAKLFGLTVAITREQFPATAKDEYYWADLVGLSVVTVLGMTLGKVDHLIETGANDVLVVKGERERLIPFLQGDVIKDVDLSEKQMMVDWDPEF